MKGIESMQKKVFQLLVDNTSGVLSRISGLFSRRGYNIESITAGVTADPRYTRITIVTSGDDEILDQIEKQVGKLVDVRDIKVLEPDESVFRELILIKIKVTAENRLSVIGLVDSFKGSKGNQRQQDRQLHSSVRRIRDFGACPYGSYRTWQRHTECYIFTLVFIKLIPAQRTNFLNRNYIIIRRI